MMMTANRVKSLEGCSIFNDDGTPTDELIDAFMEYNKIRFFGDDQEWWTPCRKRQKYCLNHYYNLYIEKEKANDMMLAWGSQDFS